MSVFGKICLGHAIRKIKKRANALDQIKAYLLNVRGLKPFPKHPPLYRWRCFAQRLNCQRGSAEILWQKRFEKIFLLCSNGRRSPDILPNVSAKGFFQVRNHAAADPISQRSQVTVRFILAKLQSMRAKIFVDLVSPNIQEWPDNGKTNAVDLTHRHFADRAQTAQPRAAEKIDQKRLDQIISMMAKKDCATLLSLCGLGKEFVTCLPRCRFD